MYRKKTAFDGTQALFARLSGWLVTIENKNSVIFCIFVLPDNILLARERKIVKMRTHDLLERTREANIFLCCDFLVAFLQLLCQGLLVVYSCMKMVKCIHLVSFAVLRLMRYSSRCNKNWQNVQS